LASTQESSKPAGPLVSASAKNKKKKEQRKKQKNKQEIIKAIYARNASEIKGPADMAEKCVIAELIDIKLKNYNPISRYESRLKNQTSSKG
jgi:hypothetical protein